MTKATTAIYTEANAPPLMDRAFHLGDPYPTYRELRARMPLGLHPQGYWVVTKHADLLAISCDPFTFCNSRGLIPGDVVRDAAEESAPTILHMDPPQHRRYRRLAQPAFSRRYVAPLEPFIRRLAAERLDAIEPGETVEYVDAFAAPLPTIVIAELLGIPSSDRDLFRKWSDATIEVAGTGEDSGGTGELLAYLADVIAERRKHPRDDMISRLIAADVDGERLDEQQLQMFGLTLLVAGNETTRNLLAQGTRALAQHPDQLAILVADPAAIPTGVEEMLRLESPIIGFLRTATRDVTLRGQKIREGDRLWLCYASANRDEDVFGPDADEFRVARNPNPHLAFGIGEHFCLGAALARLEARVCFEELFARFTRIEVAGPVEALASPLMRGIVRMPIRLSL